MKIRIVKPNITVMNFGFLDKALLKKNYIDCNDTIEIDFDKIVYYMQDNFIDCVNIKNEHDIRRLIEDFIKLKIGIAK